MGLMRILVAGHAPEDSFADNVYHTLIEMGHDVRVLGHITQAQYDAHWRFYARAIAERASRRAFDLDGNRLVRIAKRFRPEMVLALTREFSHETLDRLSQLCSPIKVLWWGDCPANARRYAFVEPLWDLVFIKDMVAVQKTRLVRGDVYLLHEAMNPLWHRPLSEQQHGRIVVAGNWYGFRQALVMRLLKDQIEVDCYGSRPPAWALSGIVTRHMRRYIVREEKSRIFGAGLACLNSFQYSEGDSLNCRAFEITGAGGLELVEYRPAIETCFEIGREVLAFRSYEELLSMIEKAKRDESAMRKIRQEGARRALAEHTYRHRLEVILKATK